MIMRLLQFTIPIATISENNARDHWRKKQKRVRGQRAYAAAWVRSVCDPTSRKRLPSLIRLNRLSPRLLDGDNLQGALKAIRDGVADGLGISDGPEGVPWLYGQRRAANRGVDVIIEFVETKNDTLV